MPEISHKAFVKSKQKQSKTKIKYNLDNILNFECILKIKLLVVLIYILTIPIDFSETCHLHYLQSTPARTESEFITILPDIIYFQRKLRSEEGKFTWH